MSMIRKQGLWSTPDRDNHVRRLGNPVQSVRPAQPEAKPRWPLLRRLAADGNALSRLRTQSDKVRGSRRCGGPNRFTNRWQKSLKPWLTYPRTRNCTPARTAAQCICMRTLKNAGSPPKPMNSQMEVFSPISAAGKSPTLRTAVSASPSGMKAPSIALPLMFALIGLSALILGVVWLVARPASLAQYHYNQFVIAATHLFVLGWICSVVMGAMYQLVPIALETKLYSETLARWQLGFHVVGSIGMVWMFDVWNMKQLGHFGCVFAVGLGLFVYNIARTLRRVPKWNVTATAVTVALFWISLAVTAGIFHLRSASELPRFH